MKTFTRFLILIVTFSISNGFSQTNPTIKKIQNQDLTYILNNITLISEHKTKEISIRVFIINNGSGSAENASNDEASSSFYIAVSEFDELPNQSLFTYGPFYNPKVISWSDMENQSNLVIEYGEANLRKQKTLQISLENVELAK